MKNDFLLIDPVFTTLPVGGEHLVYRDARNSPFQLSGQVVADFGPYHRLPVSLLSELGDGIWNLATNTAGLLIRFNTNSRTLALSVSIWAACRITSILPAPGAWPYMSDQAARSVTTAPPCGKFPG